MIHKTEQMAVIFKMILKNICFVFCNSESNLFLLLSLKIKLNTQFKGHATAGFDHHWTTLTV